MMPYANNNELPSNVKNVIPSQKALTMFRRVVNAQLSRKTSEEVAYASAWAALKNAGYKKNDSGNWVKKSNGAVPVYAYRPVRNAEEIIAWAKNQGFETTLEADDMHITVVYSRTPFMSVPNYGDITCEPFYPYSNYVLKGGKRSVAAFGSDKKAIVLKLDDLNLMQEWLDYRRYGASWDWDAYVPHITISYDGSPRDVSSIKPFEGEIILGATVFEALEENWSATEVPVEKAEKFTPPAAAMSAAKRALKWKDEYGDEVKGGTSVGWTRARQLASGEGVSRDVVARMSSFNRHRKNSVVAPEFSDEPWKDAGHVAWLLWGGSAGVDWAMKTMDSIQKRYINDDAFTEPDEARVRSYDLGFDGDIHVYEVAGQALYMPAATHEDYLRGAQSRAILPLANQENEAEDGGEEDKNSVKIEIEVKFAKVSSEQRIVWGWASVSTVDGKPLYDHQGDNIGTEEMVKMANEFMKDVRVLKAMHTGKRIGTVIHSLPLTKELAKSFGFETNTEGWITGTYVEDDAKWEDAKNGEFAGFSIGGKGKRNEVE